MESIIREDLFVKLEYEVEGGTLHFKATKIRTYSEEGDHEFESGPMLKGYIKFDGCMEIEPTGMHFCGRELAKQYALLFDVIYDKAIEVGYQD